MKEKMYKDTRDNKSNKIGAAQADAKADDVCRESLMDRDILGDDKYIEALEEKLGEAIQEAATCRQLTQRIQADFDNYRKRNAQISDDMKNLGVSMVVEKMLGVLDNCELARKYLHDEASLTGFNMMETQILSALQTFDLQEIEAEGMEFDAKTMNALEGEISAGNAGKVLQVISKGYMLKGKVLRPAGVKVGR